MESSGRRYTYARDTTNASYGGAGCRDPTSGLLHEQMEPLGEPVLRSPSNEASSAFPSNFISQGEEVVPIRHVNAPGAWNSFVEHVSGPPSVVSFTSDSSSISVESLPPPAFVFFARLLTSIRETSLIRKCGMPFRYLDAKIKAHMSRSRFHGWRMGILFGIFSSTLILSFNIAILVAVACKGSGFKDGFGQPFSYGTLSRISVGIHVLINALSTILLASSNYTMQVLSSPTREDLDKAHRSGTWYDIGVLSTRNLKLIPRRRLFLCVILCLSSVPLHLFYNSAAIYIAANVSEYDIFLADEASTEWRSLVPSDLYETFSNSRWSGQYDSSLVHYGDLYFAVDGFASSISNEGHNLSINSSWPETWNWRSRFDGSRPVVQAICRMNITEHPHDWINLTSISNAPIPAYAHITGVLARKVPYQDRVVFVLSFLIIVIMCNAAKLVTMLYVLFKEKAEFNVTLGDTAASFLHCPDSTTKRMCVYPREKILAEVSRRLANDPFEMERKDGGDVGNIEEDDPRVWQKQSHPYSRPGTASRSIGSYFMIVVICVSPLICLAAAFRVSRAWGTTSDVILGLFPISSGNTILVAWLANLPQLVLSFCYLWLNSECTSMAGAHEWNKLGTTRKGLRVTKPWKDQRSTYFLQLPYRWSLPLAAVSGVIHWLLSQSIFLVRIDSYDHDGLLLDDSSLGCGVSGLSIIVLCASFWVVVGTVISIGAKRLRVRIPFAASCSLVISAACHPPTNDRLPHLEKVQWGVVEQRMFDGEFHCSISSEPVQKPKPDTMYL